MSGITSHGWTTRIGTLATVSATIMAACGVAVAGAPGTASAHAAPPAHVLSAGTPTVVPDSYIAVFRDTVSRATVSSLAASLASQFGGHTGQIFHDAVRGFEVSLPAAAATRLAADPSVAYVQQNGVYRAADVDSPVRSWGLDRIDQAALPLDNSYGYPTVARGVKAYIIDSGIRLSHSDFGGRAISGIDIIDGGTADDANGHGTHVAGTVGGRDFGVAKGVTLVAVRVLDATGSGTAAQVIAGIDWVTGDHAAGQAAVANLSLGTGADTALDTAVTNSIADGITYGVAAGNNSGVNACTLSPARVPAAITVGATAINDARATFSNIGTCLDLFAPGQSIVSDWFTGDTATNTLSGTSMAAPHVVGAAALVLAQHPGFTPAQVRDDLVNRATVGVVTDPGTGSPNRLLRYGL